MQALVFLSFATVCLVWVVAPPEAYLESVRRRAAMGATA